MLPSETFGTGKGLSGMTRMKHWRTLEMQNVK